MVDLKTSGRKGFLTRRDFMRGTVCAALGAVLPLPPGGTEKAGKSRVVLVRRADALRADFTPNPPVIGEMLDEAVSVLMGRGDPLEAWQLLVDPGDIVGVKSNVWGYLPTPAALEVAIKKRLLDVGIPEGNISIDDRGVLGNPVFREATALINVRPLRTHFWAGIGGCLKNYIMFAPHPPDYHDDSCADLALLWELPAVRGKTRLNVLSVLTPLFHGRGPHHFDRRYVWGYNGIIVGTDPVAVDAVGLRIIRAKRVEYFGEERRLETIPKHIVSAEVKHGLGTSNFERIELIRMGWKEGMLI